VKIYAFQAEDEYADPPVHFTNPHKAMGYLQEIRPGISATWYQITPTWWRGVANDDFDVFSVVEYELHE
jgi:hypothetical protein